MKTYLGIGMVSAGLFCAIVGMVFDKPMLVIPSYCLIFVGYLLTE